MVARRGFTVEMGMAETTGPGAWRVRQLRAKGARAGSYGTGRLADAFRDDGGVGYEVSAEQDVLTTQAVEDALARHSLRSSDLVFENGSWVSLVDSVAFGEAARPAAKREAWRWWVKTVVANALLIGGGLALILLLLHFFPLYTYPPPAH